MIYLFIAGCFSAFISLALFKRGENWRPTACLFSLAALVQVLVSVIVYQRSDAKANALLAVWRESPDSMVTQELLRVVGVLERFTYFKGLEVLLAAMSLLLLIKWRNNIPWRLFFIGLLLEMVAMFYVDYQAEQRARIYFNALKGQSIEMPSPALGFDNAVLKYDNDLTDRRLNH